MVDTRARLTSPEEEVVLPSSDPGSFPGSLRLTLVPLLRPHGIDITSSITELTLLIQTSLVTLVVMQLCV